MTEPNPLDDVTMAWCAAKRFHLVLEHVLPYLEGAAAQEVAYTMASLEIDTPDQHARMVAADARSLELVAELDAWYEDHPPEPATAEALEEAGERHRRVKARVAELIEDGQRRRRSWERGARTHCA